MLERVRKRVRHAPEPPPAEAPAGGSADELRDLAQLFRQSVERLSALLDDAEAARRQAERAEERFRELVEGLDGIVWEAEAQSFRYTFVSRRAEAVLGYSVNQWLRNPNFRSELMDPDDREGALATYEEALRPGACRRPQFHAEYRLTTADGRSVWFHDQVHVVCDAAGVPSRMRGIMVEITERKRMERELELAHLQALEAEIEKKRFYRDVIRAVTGGKFELVDRDAIPEAGELLASLPLRTGDDYAHARDAINEASHAAGLAEDRAIDLVLAAGEAITNVLKHARDGEFRLYRTADALVLRVCDRGNGIRSQDLPAAILVPGFSTKVSLGMGYSMMLKLSDRVWLSTGPEGTTVQIEKLIQPPAQGPHFLEEIMKRL
jgi:PAS domain S-box-containing protein